MIDYGRQRRRRRHSGYSKYSRIFLLSNIVRLALFGLIVLIIGTSFLFVWYGRSLPTPGKLIDAPLSESTRIYDKNEELLYSVYQDQNRTYVELSKIPLFLKQATIAIEDKDFYKNQGFSITGYIRAVRDMILYRRVTGGSTITQQLVKNVLLTSERSIQRKIKELILSLQVDRRYSKDQILEMYLNDVSYGGANVGVEAAAQSYFGKDVADLDLAESAFLSGLPQRPSVYSPFSGNNYYIDRTGDVLKQMVRENYISENEKEIAYDKINNYKFATEDKTIKAPHFVMYVRKLLAEQFGEEVVANGGLQVTTSLDYAVQKEAEEIVREEIDKLKGYNVGNASVIVSNPKTGEIVSMVGSKDYFDKDNDGNFNASLSNRQPGSSLKPIMYATAFSKGYTPGTVVLDVKTEFPTNELENPIYMPVNYDGEYRGPVQLRFALGNSINVPAVKMLARIGIKDVMQMGYDMGISNWQPTRESLKDVGLSLVLGGRETSVLNITTAYGVFANKGIRQDSIAILKVTDPKGNVLYEYKKTDGRRVLSEEISFLISHILLDNVARTAAFGPNSWLVIPGKTVSVKTGTTDEKRDNWTVGYTSSFVVGVWVGNNDNSPMNDAIASGVTGASPIWNRIMKEVLKDTSDEQLQVPEGVVALTIDSFGGGLPVEDQTTRAEYFIKGTEPTGRASIYKTLRLSKHQNGKLANQEEIDRNDYDTKNYIVFNESDPVSNDGENRWQEGINEWLNNQYSEDDKYHPPTETSDHKYEEPTVTPTPSPTSVVTPTLPPTETLTPMPTI